MLRPFLAAYAGMNLVGGQFVAVFGSADRYLARVAALLGDPDAAERHFAAALAMDRRMGSVVHIAETLAAHALVLHATPTRPGPARSPPRPGHWRSRSARSGCCAGSSGYAARPARLTSPPGRWRCSRCWPGA